jgi:hypothetical protein
MVDVVYPTSHVNLSNNKSFIIVKLKFSNPRFLQPVLFH